MTPLHTAARMALDALEKIYDATPIDQTRYDLCKALRAALAAPMPEPVATVLDDGDCFRLGEYLPPGTKLYATPPAAPADSQPRTTKPVVSQKAANLPDNADMVMVPREPTPEMRHAGWNAWMLETQAALMRDPGPEQDGPRSNIAAAYRAMIAAAPPAAPAPVVPLTDEQFADMVAEASLAVDLAANPLKLLAFARAVLSAAPVVREPLTREAIDAIWNGMGSFTDRQSDWRLFARAIERAHGIGGGGNG